MIVNASRLLSLRSHSALYGWRVAGLSTMECQPAIRLKEAIQEYRQENFSRETPGRFRKQLFKPYMDNNNVVSVDELNKLLVNIGHPQDCLSEEEKKDLLHEVGSHDRSISLQKIMQLIS